MSLCLTDLSRAAIWTLGVCTPVSGDFWFLSALDTGKRQSCPPHTVISAAWHSSILMDPTCEVALCGLLRHQPNDFFPFFSPPFSLLLPPFFFSPFFLLPFLHLILTHYKATFSAAWSCYQKAEFRSKGIYRSRAEHAARRFFPGAPRGLGAGRLYQLYANAKHTVAKPGDKIALKGVDGASWPQPRGCAISFFSFPFVSGPFRVFVRAGKPRMSATCFFVPRFFPPFFFFLSFFSPFFFFFPFSPNFFFQWTKYAVGLPRVSLVSV